MLSQFASYLSRVPLEPTSISLEPSPDGLPACPLHLCVVAPCAITADHVSLDIAHDCKWLYPFRLARVAVRPRVDEAPSTTADTWRARIDSLIVNMMPSAILVIPRTSTSSSCTTLELQSVVRPCNNPSYDPCVLVDIPVPAGIVLRPGVIIRLSVSICGARFRVDIPGSGHMHSDTCNHKQEGKGAVWNAAFDSDSVALEAALASGGSTEEADQVRATGMTPQPLCRHNVPRGTFTGRQHFSHACGL